MGEQHDLDEDAANDNVSWVKETLAIRGLTEVPTRLYKFVSVDSKYFPLAMHELLLHSRIYLSCRKDFNDPFDSAVGLDTPETREAIERFIVRVAAQNPGVSAEQFSAEHIKDPEAWARMGQQALDSSFDSVGIYSFADSVKHPLMWAHYASSHRGVALIFRHGLEDTFGAFPIRYQDDYPRVKIGPKGIDAYTAFIKGVSWSYEGEWRIAQPNSARKWFELPAAVFDGVVFGARVAEETVDFVLDLVKRRVDAKLPPVPVYRARARIGESFHLDFYRLMPGGWKLVDLR